MPSTIPQIKGTGDVQRKYMACAIDVSEDPATPDFVVVGYKITSSAVEFNPDEETGTDINGRNFSSVNKFEPSQTFEPHRVTAGRLGAIGAKLIQYFRFNELEKFSQFKCVLIHGYLAENFPNGPFPADKYDKCTLTPQSLGGESWLEAPFNVVFGGDVTHGTVDSLLDSTAFTETVLVP